MTTAGGSSRAGGSNHDYVTAINADKKDVTVRLVADSGTWEARFRGASPDVKPNQNVPHARVLRRARILRLVDAQPHDRYKALGEYIELQGVTKSEDALRTAEKTVSATAEAARNKWEQATTSLKALWDTEGKPDSSSLVWGKNESERDLSAMSAELESVKTLRTKIEKLDSSRTEWLNAKSAQKDAKKTAGDAQVALEKEEAKTAGQNSNLVSLLQKAKAFLDGNDGSDCPVCQQKVDRRKLSVDLEKRIDSMETLKRLSENLKSAKKELMQAANLTDNSLKAYAKHIHAAAKCLGEAKLALTTNAKLSSDILETLAATDTTDADCAEKVETIFSQLLPIAESLKMKEQRLQKAVNLNASIKTQYETVIAQKSVLDAKKQLAERLSHSLKIVVACRKAFVGQELASISDEAARLYGALHPNEDIGRIKLSLDPKTPGSLLLTGSFYTESDITPQSLFSESHLDTLGFSVFFALAKKYRSNDAIVVLDDVVTSVDESHLDRFITLLHDEARHFSHIIVTTHYRPWRERYRFNRAPGSGMHFIDLRPWSMERGIRAENAKLAINELRHALDVEAFNRRDIANQAGILVESLLDFLTLKFMCRLPRKAEPGYTLRELCDSLPRELLKNLKVEFVSVVTNPDNTIDVSVRESHPLEPVISQLKLLSAVRNQVGCHFNYDGALVSDKDIEDFGRFALQLGELLSCPDEGDLPTRDKSGSYWETRSRKVRLYPLVTPKN